MAQQDVKASPDSPAERKPAVQVVSWFRLFNCDAFDYLAIFLGLAGSLANAPIMPLFAVVFGDVCFFATLACVLLTWIGTRC